MIQIIECKCGKIIAGCAVPYCYESEEWHESLRYHTSMGCVVSYKQDYKVNFKKCDCNVLDDVLNIFDTVILLE